MQVGNQKFNVTLGKTIYKLRLIYRIDEWYLDTLDTSEKPLITGLLLCPGIDLLEQYKHVIPHGLYVTISNPDELSTFDSLGSKIKLYYED
nr:hypothetical protein [Acinetobacter sp. YH12255]